MIEDSTVEKERDQVDEQKNLRKKKRIGVQKKTLSDNINNNNNIDFEDYVLSENMQSWT